LNKSNQRENKHPNSKLENISGKLLDIFAILTGFSTINFSEYTANNFLFSNFKVVSVISDDLKVKLIGCVYDILHKDDLIMKSVLNSKVKFSLINTVNEELYEDY